MMGHLGRHYGITISRTTERARGTRARGRDRVARRAFGVNPNLPSWGETYVMYACARGDVVAGCDVDVARHGAKRA